MVGQADANETFELFEELLTAPLLGETEQLPLQQLTALHMQAYALTRPDLTAADRQVIGLVIGRWLYTVTNKDLGLHFCGDAFKIAPDSFGSVLGLDAQSVQESLQRLASLNLIAVEPAQPSFSVSLAPLLAQIAPDVLPLLYRDFLDRRGLDLHDTATHYLESLAEHLEELANERPADPRVKVLRSDYDALKARSTPDELLAQWADRPKAMYGWLEELAAIEERLAILCGRPNTSLASDLARHASERILILSGRFVPSAPPPASANAA